MTGFRHVDTSMSNDTDLSEDVSKSKVPESIDWRKQNCVTDVKDQVRADCIPYVYDHYVDWKLKV